MKTATSPVLFAEGWWRPNEFLDFELLGPIVGHMTMYSVPAYSYDVLDWHLLDHWLPIPTAEIIVRVKREMDFRQVKVKHIELLGDRTPLVMFVWATRYGSPCKMLATQQEYDAIKELSESCTHFYGTWRILPGLEAAPDADQQYFMRGIIRKSDEELQNLHHENQT